MSGVLVYRSNRTEALADALADVLQTPAGDPWEPELVVVPSRGMERWLAMRLSERLGVCANVRFPFPAAALRGALTAVLGEEVEAADAWQARRLSWAVLAVLPGLLGREELQPLRAYLGDDATGHKRLQLAGRIADVFDRYATYRPDLVLAWERGEAVRGPGRRLQRKDAWQPVLWRALARHLGTPCFASLVERFVAQVAGEGLPPAGLPPRVCWFGISSLPPAYLRLLAALGRHTEVHLLVPCPSDAWWADLRSKAEIDRELVASGGDAEDLHLEEGHPLLGSLGRLQRDFQLLLEDAGYLEPRDDLFADPGTDTVLHALQSDLLHVHTRREGGDVAPLVPAPDDRSVRVEACHGPMRQVEVLADVLHGLFEELPDLQPRDVVVMTPDVEAYAPLIEAVFDRDAGDPRHVPWRIVDRGLRLDNPVARALQRVLEVADGRLPASEVLDLLVAEPIRRRFALGAEDLETLTRWVARSGVRWGIDAEHRHAHGQPARPENTWRFGLDRLLLGVAMDGEGRRLFGGALPADEVEGGAAELLGRLAELCETLFGVVRDLAEPRSPTSWREVLCAPETGLLDRLVATSDADAWQVQEVRGAVDELVGEAEAGGFSDALPLESLRALLVERLSEPAGAHGFASGAITFCALVPMRAIPFRVVCLLGMDDGVFPRVGARLGFDLVAHEPRRGDRPAREDDRALFLDALLAARDRLVITYAGRRARDNQRLPPAVPVVELLDTLCDGLAPPGDDPEEAPRDAARRLLVADHPLQPFSPRCFGPDRRLASFAAEFLPGAARVAGERRAPPPFVAGPLAAPAEAEETVRLDDLARLFGAPVPYLVQRRLGVWLGDREEGVEDREPIELSALERYAVAEALLQRRLAGEDVTRAYESVRAAGLLPLGVPGRCRFSDLLPEVEALAALGRQVRDGPATETLAVDVALPGARLVGRLRRLSPGGQVRCRYARIKPSHLLALWVDHLALQMASGPRPSVLVGRPPTGAGAATRRLRPVDAAAEVLAALVGLYRAGRREPLLLFPATSLAWAARLLASPGAFDAAQSDAARAWLTHSFDLGIDLGDGADQHVARVFADQAPYEPGFTPDWGEPPAGRSFAALAEAVWAPLLGHLEEE